MRRIRIRGGGEYIRSKYIYVRTADNYTIFV